MELSGIGKMELTQRLVQIKKVLINSDDLF